LAPPELQTWRLRASGDSGAQVTGLETAGRSLFAVGSFSGDMEWADQRLSSLGGSDVFVARFEPTGPVRWLLRLGGAGEDQGDALALATDGAVVAVGMFSGQADFAGLHLQRRGDSDCFVARLSADEGRALWARGFGGQGNTACRSVAVDAAGDLIVTGRFDGTVDLGFGPLRSVGLSDTFLLKLSGKDGTPIWARHFGGAGDDIGRDVAVGPSGTLFVVGHFSSAVSGEAGAIDFGTGRLTSAGDSDAFLAAFSEDGHALWARAIGGPTFDMVKSIVVASDGALYLTGLFQGNVTPQPGELLFSAGGFEGFLAGYTSSGVERWTHRWPRMTSGHALTLSPGGELILVGHFTESLELGLGPPLTSAGGNDAVVAGFSTDGELRWARRFGDTAPDYGYAVATSKQDVVLGGMSGRPPSAEGAPSFEAYLTRVPTATLR
jgi:hypothetical protein